MNSRELAKQILTSSADMDYLDYVETYDQDINDLAAEIDNAKEMNLVCILNALETLSN